MGLFYCLVLKLDGLNISSLKGALMTRGTKEISNLIVAMRGKIFNEII